MRATVLFAVLSLASFTAAPAFADDEKPASSGAGLDPSLRGPGSLSDASPKRRHPMISLFVGLPAIYWGYGGFPLSVGGRYLQPILHDGFVPSINDSVSIEVGADLYAISRLTWGLGLAIPVEALWALHFSPKFAGYLKLGIAIELRFGDWCWGNVCTGALGIVPVPVGALGIMYDLTEALTLRVELGYPGLKVGLGFPL